MLLDGIGHGYTVKYERKKGDLTTWRCSFRPKNNPCKGSVNQIGDIFEMREPHSCVSKQDLHTHVAIKAKAKELGMANIYEPAVHIVEPLMNDQLKRNKNLLLPDPNLIVRSVNRLRQSNRPKNPKDLFFEIDFNHIPAEFSVTEVFVGSGKNRKRHLAFATEKQIDLLKKCTRIFMDGMQT